MCSACIPTGGCWIFCRAFFPDVGKTELWGCWTQLSPRWCWSMKPCSHPCCNQVLHHPQDLLGLWTWMLSQQELNIVPAGHKLCWHLGVLSQFRKEQRPFPCGLVPGRSQWACFPTMTLQGCPQQFGTEGTCFQAAANICGDKWLQRVAGNYQKEEPALCKQ